MKRTVLSLASLALLLAAAACGASSPTEPGDARFDGAPADTTARGGGTIGSGT